MRVGGWYRLSKRGGIYVSAAIPRHAAHAHRAVATHPQHVGLGCLVWLAVLALIAVMLLAR